MNQISSLSTNRQLLRSGLLSYCSEHNKAQLALLEKLIIQPSHTSDKRGVDAVGAIISEELLKCGMSLEINFQEHNGNHLIFRTEACQEENNQGILLVGHMDTVFPPESSFNWFKDDGEKLYGPGVIDMKGGLVVAIFAIKSLYQQGILHDIPITFICNSDEETGSLTSKDLICKEAKKSNLALVFECGGLNGELVTGRKGKTGYRLTVQGQAGHAAFAGKDKASAILELAKKITALERLNDPGAALVVNVGQISGGVGPNTIAEHAEALIDTRFITEKVCAQNKEDINHITKECTTPGTNASIDITSARPPMEQSPQNIALYNLIEYEAESLGIQVCDELRSGVSDANFIASSGTPVVDGLGPIGDCDHSDKEYLIKPSLLEKTKLTVCTLHALWLNSF